MRVVAGLSEAAVGSCRGAGWSEACACAWGWECSRGCCTVGAGWWEEDGAGAGDEEVRIEEDMRWTLGLMFCAEGRLCEELILVAFILCCCEPGVEAEDVGIELGSFRLRADEFGLADIP